MSKSILIEKSYQFSLDIVSLYYDMINNNEYTISKQILKSGTSIGANVREANFAESKADFIHKIKIAQKECSETIYWLDIIKDSNRMDYEVKKLHIDSLIIMKILYNTIKSIKSNKNSLP